MINPPVFDSGYVLHFLIIDFAVPSRSSSVICQDYPIIIVFSSWLITHFLLVIYLFQVNNRNTSRAKFNDVVLVALL